MSPDWRISARAALFAFCVSRALVFGIWAAVACLKFANPASAEVGLPMIDLQAGTVLHAWRELASYNDASWYFGIATDGYETRPFDSSREANWAFFPLHPLLWKAFMQLGGDPVLSGVLLANFCFLLALFLLHRLALAFDYDAAAADRAVGLLALSPTSYFFSLPWSESLFLLLSVAVFLAAIRRYWMWMAFAGICACACRFAGLFLLPALAIWMWPQRKQLPYRAWIALATFPLGLCAFMSMLWFASGNPLAFIDIQITWGRQLGLPFKALGIVLVKPWVLASDWNFRYLNVLTFCAGCIASYWLAKRRREWAAAAFLVLGLGVPAMTGSVTSMARYGMALFPLALFAADATRRPLVEKTWLVLSAVLLGLMCIAFQLRLTFAGA